MKQYFFDMKAVSMNKKAGKKGLLREFTISGIIDLTELIQVLYTHSAMRQEYIWPSSDLQTAILWAFIVTFGQRRKRRRLSAAIVAKIAIVGTALQDLNPVIDDAVDKAVDVVYPSAPIALEITF